jgi:hypothetical protein
MRTSGIVRRLVTAVLVAMLVSVVAPQRVHAMYENYACSLEECNANYGYMAWMAITCYTGRWGGCFGK